MASPHGRGRNQKSERKALTLWLTLLVTLGALLRLMYFAVTGPTERVYDVEGHIEYIEYVATNAAIPPTKEGWQFYQPPLYYAFAAPVYKAAVSLLDLDRNATLRTLQSLSLFLSLAGLFLGLSLAFSLFRESPRAIPAFIGAFAVFPALIFQSGQINNDVLLTFLALLSLAMLAAWWRSLKHWLFFGAVVAGSLAFLTKANGVLLPLIAIGSLLLHPDLGGSAKSRLGLAAIALCIVIAGWYPVHRLMSDRGIVQSVSETGNPAAFVVTNLTNLHGGLRVENGLENYFTFNPAAFIPVTYNHSWSDPHRRQYLWEYFYRSMLLADDPHGDKIQWISMAVLTLGLLLPLAAAVGVIAWVRGGDAIGRAMAVAFILVITAHVVMRFLAPFSSTQSFRYATALVVPLLYFAVAGIEALPMGTRGILRSLWCVFVAACCGLFVSFALYQL